MTELISGAGEGDRHDLPRGDVAVSVSSTSSDEEAFRVLYAPLRRFAAVVAPSDAEPDDLVQEALCRVLARGGLARLEHPLAYLRRSVFHLAVNQGRSNRRRASALGRVGLTQGAWNPVNYPSEVWGLLDLPPVDRAVLYLCDVEGWSYAEIADLLDAREGTLRGRASRARRRLRKQLQQGEET